MSFLSLVCQRNTRASTRRALRINRGCCGIKRVSIAVISIVCLGWGPVAKAEYFVPTSLGGSLSYGYGYSKIAIGESEQTTLTLNINGGGFFWQPWFLTMGAGVGLGLSESDSNASFGATSKTISGSMDFTLFPESRFPSSVGFSVTDSRQEVQQSVVIPGQHYQVFRFYVRQSYNALNGANINAWFYQNSVAISNQSDDSLDRSLGFQVQKRQSHHDFDFNGSFLYTNPALSEIETLNTNLTFTHIYSPSTELGVSSLVSYTNVQTSGAGYQDFDFSYEQMSSAFYWRPEHRPYQVGGAVLFSSSGSSSRRINTNANANYRFTRNINAGAGIGVGVSDSDGRQTVDSSQSLSVNAFSDQYVFLGFDYGWSASMGLSNVISRTDGNVTTSTEESTRNTRSMNLSVNHRVSRGISLGRNSTVSVSAGQGVGASKSSNSDEVSSSISNSASAGWNHYGFGGNTSANASISDSRTLGKNDSEFQVFSAQLSRAQEITRLSNLSGNVNYQSSRSAQSDAAGVEDVVTGQSASASLNYTHARFLGVHSLLYSSQLSFPSLIQADNAVSQAGREWNNTLSYRVGLLSLGMTARVAEIGDNERAFTMTFTAIRSF